MTMVAPHLTQLNNPGVEGGRAKEIVAAASVYRTNKHGGTVLAEMVNSILERSQIVDFNTLPRIQEATVANTLVIPGQSYFHSSKHRLMVKIQNVQETQRPELDHKQNQYVYFSKHLQPKISDNYAIVAGGPQEKDDAASLARSGRDIGIADDAFHQIDKGQILVSEQHMPVSHNDTLCNQEHNMADEPYRTNTDWLRIPKDFVNACLWQTRLVLNLFDLQKSVDMTSSSLTREIFDRLIGSGLIVYVLVRITYAALGDSKASNLEISPLRWALFFFIWVIPIAFSYYLVGRIRSAWFRTYSQWFAFHVLLSMNMLVVYLVSYAFWSLLVTNGPYEQVLQTTYMRYLLEDENFKKWLIIPLYFVYLINTKRFLEITYKGSFQVNLYGYSLYMLLLILVITMGRWMSSENEWVKNIGTAVGQYIDKFLHVAEVLIQTVRPNVRSFATMTGSAGISQIKLQFLRFKLVERLGFPLRGHCQLSRQVDVGTIKLSTLN